MSGSDIVFLVGGVLTIAAALAGKLFARSLVRRRQIAARMGLGTSGQTERGLRMERRISPHGKELIEHAASLKGITPSEFVVSQSVIAPRETIGRLEATRLTAEDRDAFLRAFEDEEVNEEVVDVYRFQAAFEVKR